MAGCELSSRRLVARRAVPVLLAGLTFALPAAAQEPRGGEGKGLAERVEAVRDGRVGFDFAAREGVCGCRNCRFGAGCGPCIDERHLSGEGEWRGACASGPVLVSITLRDGRVASLRSYVGGSWVSGALVDLGSVDPIAAADYLLSLAERPGTAAVEAAEDALFPATLAAGATAWPRLLAIARDRGLDEEVRESAVFWVGQAAGDAAVAELEAFVGEEPNDLEVREQAVFALSELPAAQAIPALMRVARTNPHPELRRAALFWLAESDDPRALELFEEILTAN